LLLCPRLRGALSDAAIRPSVSWCQGLLGAQRHGQANVDVLLVLFFCLTPVLSSEGMKKITLCQIQKKYKNQAGMNLTPSPPSQNSHAVRWHCTAESITVIITYLLAGEYRDTRRERSPAGVHTWRDRARTERVFRARHHQLRHPHRRRLGLDAAVHTVTVATGRIATADDSDSTPLSIQQYTVQSADDVKDDDSRLFQIKVNTA